MISTLRSRQIQRLHLRVSAPEPLNRRVVRRAIDPVGLCPTPPARSCDRGWIDNMALNSFAQQDAVNPEAVQPRFLNDDYRERFSGPRARFSSGVPKSAPATPRYRRQTRCALTSSPRGLATAK
jgi:hypothetical protein